MDFKYIAIAYSSEHEDDDVLWNTFADDFVKSYNREYTTTNWRKYIISLDIGLLYKFKYVNGKKCHVYYIVDEKKYMLGKIKYEI